LKVALSSMGEGLDSPVALDFDRAPYFIIYKLEDESYEALINPAFGIPKGFGVQTAQTLISRGVNAVISDGFDPWVFQMFRFSGVELFRIKGTTVREAIERFKRGELKRWEPDTGAFWKAFFHLGGWYGGFPFFKSFFFGWEPPFDWKAVRIAQLEAMISALESQIAILRKELEDLKREG